MVEFPGVSPLLFKGGTTADYEIFRASSGALMTRHLATGSVCLSVRSAMPLKDIPQVRALIPGSAQALTAWPKSVLAKLPTSNTALGMAAGLTVIATSGYVLYRRRRRSIEREELPGFRGPREHEDHYFESSDAEAGIESRWGTVLEAWELLRPGSGDERDRAKVLLDLSRSFLDELADDIGDDAPGWVAAALYLYLARCAAAQAWAVLGRADLAVEEIRTLQQTLDQIGRAEFANLRLLDPRAHDRDVTQLWGLHIQVERLLSQIEDGKIDLCRLEVSMPDAPLLANLDHLTTQNGLELDLPIPVDSVDDLVAVQRIGADFSDPLVPRVPTVRSALSSLGQVDAEALTAPVARDALMAVLHDEQGGMGTARADFGLVEEVVYPDVSRELVPVVLDWNEVIARELSAAREQMNRSQDPLARDRIETLMFYMDGLVREGFPEVYADRVGEVQALQRELRDP